jgi:dTMP kinase
LSILLAIEGGDGAGKATAAANVAAALNAAGRTAAVVSFPRYGDTVGGQVLGNFLAGRLGREVTPEAAAVLYALDRFESRAHLIEVMAAHDVVVLDRYTASNMAYQAAKVAEPRAMMDWVLRLEQDQFAMPAADLTVYLDTPVEVARELIARKRQRSYTDRTYDEHEADLALQVRVRENYAVMAAAGLGGRWVTVAGPPRAPDEIAAEIVGLVPIGPSPRA